MTEQPEWFAARPQFRAHGLLALMCHPGDAAAARTWFVRAVAFDDAQMRTKAVPAKLYRSAAVGPGAAALLHVVRKALEPGRHAAMVLEAMLERRQDGQLRANGAVDRSVAWACDVVHKRLTKLRRAASASMVRTNWYTYRPVAHLWLAADYADANLLRLMDPTAQPEVIAVIAISEAIRRDAAAVRITSRNAGGKATLLVESAVDAAWTLGVSGLPGIDITYARRRRQ